ncbi:MAG: thiol:disulfide interchange protein DsbA [Flavobacteriales bacterium]|jgi:thiol:disulfide interchange protein DsbA
MRRYILMLITILPIFSLAETSKFVEGIHYSKIKKPILYTDKNSITVSEVFWYGCKGCYLSAPKVKEWQSTLSAGIDLEHLPAILRDSQRVHAELYYMIESLGLGDLAHHVVFKEIHENGNKLKTERQLEEFFKGFGVSHSDFVSTYKSKEVLLKVQRTDFRIRRMQIASTPAFVVDGRYIVSSTLDGGYTKIFEVINYLVEKVRSDRLEP